MMWIAKALHSYALLNRYLVGPINFAITELFEQSKAAKAMRQMSLQDLQTLFLHRHQPEFRR